MNTMHLPMRIETLIDYRDAVELVINRSTSKKEIEVLDGLFTFLDDAIECKLPVPPR